MKCGLLGEHLAHSWSPQIHAELADYEYSLYEKAPDEVENFVRHGNWQGLNVTIPYKKTVIPFCSSLSPLAKEIGSVNTLVRRSDGTIVGDNTDAYGFQMLISEIGVNPDGKKALVLGSGGASATAQAVLRSMGAEVDAVSRTGPVNYENLDENASLLVNTTPLGMFPNNGKKAVDLKRFAKIEGVIDVVYNPIRTALILQAEELGIPCTSGLRMLVGQAKRSAEIFLETQIPDSETERILHLLQAEMQNIILIGMPGCGKTTVSHLLADRLKRECLEADEELERSAGMTIPEIFAREGERGFRIRETDILQKIGMKSGAVISTGGGCVTRAENYPLLHQNGVIIRIKRDLSKLARDGRPLSVNADLAAMLAVRDPLYSRFADITVDNNGSVAETVDKIMEFIK